MLRHTLGEGQECPEITWVHARRVERGKALGAVWRRESVKFREHRESSRARSAVPHTVTRPPDQPHTKEAEFP